MKIGFVSAILPELELDDLLDFASVAGFAGVELMCWPPGKAERRYAGVTHLDVSEDPSSLKDRLAELTTRHKVEISGLGYYPNPLSPNAEEARIAVEHLKQVIVASGKIGLGVVNTFVGRDYTKSIDDNWPRFLETWRPIIQLAEDNGVRVGIENCPMLFSRDEWPGGKNLAISPAIWRRMFHDIPSQSFGLNYDPSHMIWQGMDHIAPIAEFADRLVHVHAKDARVDRKSLDDHGVLSYPKLWHTPKIPGQGDVNWGRFFGALADAGYHGHVAIEIEDRAYEGSLERRKESLHIARRYLRQFAEA